MAWTDNFYEALATWLRSMDYDAVRVTDFDEETRESGGCESCSYTTIEVTVYYTDSKGDRRYYYYDDSMAELIRSL